MARDRRDLPTDFAGPSARTNDVADRAGDTGRTGKRELSADEREAIRRELDHAFVEFREGIDLED